MAFRQGIRPGGVARAGTPSPVVGRMCPSHYQDPPTGLINSAMSDTSSSD